MLSTGCAPMIIILKTTFFVVTVVGLTVAQRTKSAKFQVMTSSEGENACATDVPNEVIWIPTGGSDVQCGLQCIQRTRCAAFNFHALIGKCDRYEAVPNDVDVIPDCQGYSVIGR